MNWLAWTFVGLGALFSVIGAVLVDRTSRSELEVARLETEQLRAQLAWRTLSADQRTNLLQSFARMAHPVTVAYLHGDPEGIYFAEQLVTVLRQAGWTVRTEARSYASDLIFGFHLPGPESAPQIAARQAFVAAHIPFDTGDLPQPDFSLVPDDAPPEDGALIMIGARRPPDI